MDKLSRGFQEDKAMVPGYVVSDGIIVEGKLDSWKALADFESKVEGLWF